MAIVSILMLYNYNEAIFDDLQLPTANDITDDADKVPYPWIPNKQDLIDYICMECAEFELLYPDWDIMKRMIKTWSRARIGIWIQLYNTMLYKYNPIWNKDGTYTETRTPNLTTKDTYTARSLKTDHTGSVSNNITGYDSDNYAPNDQTVYNTADTTTGGSDNERKETGSETTTRTETGNIGVTMTQEMIQKQRDIVMFDLYDTITSEFKEKFCLLLY